MIEDPAQVEAFFKEDERMEREEDERRAEITRMHEEAEEQKQRNSVFSRMTTAFVKDDRAKIGAPSSEGGTTPKSTSGEGSPTHSKQGA